MFFQKSHLFPRPPSHAYASTVVKELRKPGPINSMPVPQLWATVMGVPPVVFILICRGFFSFHTGQLLAGFSAAGLGDEGPLAISLAMDGLPVCTKLLSMPEKAAESSGPWFALT